MAERNGHGHFLRGLVAGVAEHHALVPGAAHLVVGAQGDVGGLLVDAGDDAAGVAVEAVLGPVIADVPHHIPDDLGDVHIALGTDLAHHVDKTGGHGGLAGHTAVGVVFQDGVQHRVGDLVADLIGMPLGDGLGSKERMAHMISPFLCNCETRFAIENSRLSQRAAARFGRREASHSSAQGVFAVAELRQKRFETPSGSRTMLAQMIRNRLMISLHRRRKKKTRAVPDSARQNCLFSLIFRLTAGFGTLRFPQVAGLHRAVPSTALDKVFNCGTDYSRLLPFVKNCFRILRLRACHLEEQRDEGSYSGRWCTFLLDRRIVK